MGPRGRSFLMMSPASSGAPAPGSMRTSRSDVPKRSSRHDVLPPYFTVVGPGTGMEPRTPQKLTRMDTTALLLHDAQEDLGFLYLRVHASLHGFQVVQADAQLFVDRGRKLLGVPVPGETD